MKRRMKRRIPTQTRTPFGAEEHDVDQHPNPKVQRRWRLQQVQAGLAGLEPTTYGLGNRRSIRLSYSPMIAQPIARANSVCVT